MKIIILFLFIFTNTVFGQTSRFAGTYQYGTSPEEGRTGIINIYPTSDSTLLFYLEINRGEPSYNSGAIVGQMKMNSPNEASFSMTKENYNINCNMSFTFTDDSLFIRTIDDADDCGYGFGVYSPGDFKRMTTVKPDYFIDRTGEKTEFKNLDWENWWNWD